MVAAGGRQAGSGRQPLATGALALFPRSEDMLRVTNQDHALSIALADLTVDHRFVTPEHMQLISGSRRVPRSQGLQYLLGTLNYVAHGRRSSRWAPGSRESRKFPKVQLRRLALSTVPAMPV